MADPSIQGTGYTTESLVQAANSANSDVSPQSLLQLVFGEIAKDPLAAISGGGAGDSIFGTIFMYINMGLLTLGAIYLSYKALAAVTQTAHDGDFMGKSFHSVWVPIRLTTGIFALMPVAGGWSILQIAMLWFGIMGAGLGNMAWQGVVGAWAGAQPALVKTTANNAVGPSFAKDLLNAWVCVESKRAQADIAAGISGTANNVQAGVIRQQKLFSSTNEDWFGTNGGHECGIVTTTKSARKRQAIQGGNTFSREFLTESQINTVRAAGEQVYDGFSAQIHLMATDIVKHASTVITNPDKAANYTFDPALIEKAGGEYQLRLRNSIATAANAVQATPMAVRAMQEHARTDGFVSAGAWYTTYAAAASAMTNFANDLAPGFTFRPVPPGPSESIYKYAHTIVEVPSDTKSSQYTSIPADKNVIFANSFGTSVVSWFVTDSSGTPALIRIKNIADRAVVTTEAAITALGAISAATKQLVMQANSINDIKGLSSLVTGGATGIAAAAAWGAAEPWVDFMMFIFKVFIGFCLSASIYIPLIPFIVFAGQILNWMLTVIEGVCAAPFLAFAHLDTDGEGLGHRTQYGYTFALTSFMRPVMLVLGFVVSSVLIETICTFLMRIYPTVIENVQSDSVTGIVSIIGFTVIFFTISIGLITSAASVMYILPDAIFSFMGASSSATSQAGRDVERGVGNTTTGGIAAATQVKPANLRKNEAIQKKMESLKALDAGAGVRGAGGSTKS